MKHLWAGRVTRPLNFTVLGGIFFAFPLGVTTMRIRYFLGIALLAGLWGCSCGDCPAEVFL